MREAILSYGWCAGVANRQSPVDDRYAQVAQLVEQWTENPRVGGSNPPLGTISLLNMLDILKLSY